MKKDLLTTEEVADERGRWQRGRDWFTPDEAAFYCHLDSVRSLETLEADYGLIAFKGLSKSKMYHRRDLDKAMERFFGQQQGAVQPGKLKMAR